ncbi:efflux RND transporter permease subunit [Halorientalis sp.]|uniref:efflux RND transporter permease subunit n=1 Tax=Halorientalis sp. TaxID=1931229 RepID=UPI00262B7987|nr:efflux RND transporter permease subunit [Halorientalis sp.]
MTTEFGSRIRDRLESVGRYAATHRRRTVVAVLLLAVLSLGVGVMGVQMSMGMTLYIDDESQTTHDWETLKQDFDTGNNVFVVVESDRLYAPETVRTIDRLDRRYTKNVDSVAQVESLADIVRRGNGGRIPETEAGVRRAIDRVRAESPMAAAQLDQLQPERGTTVLLAGYGEVQTFERGSFLPQRGADIVYNELQDETKLAALPPGVSVTITGQPVFENAAFGLMLPEMIALFAGAFALIFVVVYLVMRQKVERGWHVLLPLGTAITALLYMMGAMGVLGYDFNAIMLGVMPIALGLGIDYTLQIHSRYVEQRRAGNDPVDAAGDATRTTGRALLIAMGTTVVGLGSLLVSAVPPVRQFGVVSATAVLAAMVLSVTLLPALLVWSDRDGYVTPTDDDDARDPLESGVRRFTTLVSGGRPLLTLAIAALLVTGGAYAYPQVEPNQEMMDFWPQNLDAKGDMERLTDTVDSPNAMFVIVESDRAYSSVVFDDIATYQRLLLANDRVNAVQSPVTQIAAANGGTVPDEGAEFQRLLDRVETQSAANADPTSTLGRSEARPNRVVLTVYTDDVEGPAVRTLIEQHQQTAETTLPPSADVRITGKPVLNRNVIENVTAGLTPMTILSFSLGLVFLTLAFLSWRISVTLIASVAGSAALLVTGAMYLFEIPWNPLTITMSSLTLGIGVDYGIHIFERYEQEVHEYGRSPRQAAATAVGKLSRPIIGSSFTTIFGFGVLLVSRFPVLSNFGKTTVLAIGFSLLASFIILPAALTFTQLTVEDTTAESRTVNGTTEAE